MPQVDLHSPINGSDRLEAPPLWEIEFQLAELTSEQTGIARNSIIPSSRLFEDLHIDSLDMVELILAVEEKFGVTIPDDIGKQMFVAQPLTINVLAGIVHHQWGTGTPAREGWRQASQSLRSEIPSVISTQLGGHLSERDWLTGDLFESMADTPQGSKQYRRRTDGMRCVVVPAAEVEIGSDSSDSDQRPGHVASFGSFLIDAEPVSVKAFARFLNSASQQDQQERVWCGVEQDDRRRAHFQLQLKAKEWSPLPGTEEQPMVLVSWFGARAYSCWANRRPFIVDDGNTTEAAWFLPTEGQWEYAARGSSRKPFPWGDAPATPERAHVGLHLSRAKYPAKLPLADVSAKLGISPFGLHHMAGNIWHWCADWYDPTFYAKDQASRLNPRNDLPTLVRSERGGSWIGAGDLARSSYRRGRLPEARGRCLGFRCVGFVEDLPR